MGGRVTVPSAVGSRECHLRGLSVELMKCWALIGFLLSFKSLWFGCTPSQLWVWSWSFQCWKQLKNALDRTVIILAINLWSWHSHLNENYGLPGNPAAAAFRTDTVTQRLTSALLPPCCDSTPVHRSLPQALTCIIVPFTVFFPLTQRIRKLVESTSDGNSDRKHPWVTGKAGHGWLTSDGNPKVWSPGKAITELWNIFRFIKKRQRERKREEEERGGGKRKERGKRGRRKRYQSRKANGKRERDISGWEWEKKENVN